jgi:hypothetical protein
MADLQRELHKDFERKVGSRRSSKSASGMGGGMAGGMAGGVDEMDPAAILRMLKDFDKSGLGVDGEGGLGGLDMSSIDVDTLKEMEAALKGGMPNLADMEGMEEFSDMDIDGAMANIGRKGAKRVSSASGSRKRVIDVEIADPSASASAEEANVSESSATAHAASTGMSLPLPTNTVFRFVAINRYTVPLP